MSQKHLLQSDTARKINALFYPKNTILSFAGALHHYLPLLDSNPPVRKKIFILLKFWKPCDILKGFAHNQTLHPLWRPQSCRFTAMEVTSSLPASFWLCSFTGSLER